MKKDTTETEKSRKLYFWVYDFTDVCVYVIIFIPCGYSVNLIYTGPIDAYDLYFGLTYTCNNFIKICS